MMHVRRPTNENSHICVTNVNPVVMQNSESCYLKKCNLFRGPLVTFYHLR